MRLLCLSVFTCLAIANLSNAQSQKEFKFTKVHEKAWAKYDHIQEPYRSRIVAAWKAEFQRWPPNRAKMTRNEPLWFPPIVRNDGRANMSIPKDSVGTAGSVDGAESGRVHVFQVVSKSKIMVKEDERLFYFIDGIDASNLTDGRAATIPGLFYADGTESFTNGLGVKRTIHVIRPVPTVDAKK